MEIRRVEPKVAVWSDVDESLVGPDPAGVEASRVVLDRYAPTTLVGYCTGRGPISAAHQAPVLAHFPLNVYGVNNGLSLYWNKDQEEASEFIRTLGQRKEDPDWAAHVRERAGKWDMATIRTCMMETLKAHGYEEEPNKLPIPYDSMTVMRGPNSVYAWVAADQPMYYISNPGGHIGPQQLDVAQTLGGFMRDRMLEDGMRVKYLCHPPKESRVMSTFEPPGVNKVAALQYVLSRFPSVKGVITIGDAFNDTHLDAYEFGAVTNHPILAGDWHPNLALLRAHPRTIWRPSGQVAPALEQHFRNLKGVS